MIMYGDLEKSGKEGVMAYLAVLPWHSPRGE
jgi:hypothetical protein